MDIEQILQFIPHCNFSDCFSIFNPLVVLFSDPQILRYLFLCHARSLAGFF